MKFILYSIFLVWFVNAQSLSVSPEYLIYKSDLNDISVLKTELESKSREFLRYARNEISARKGYVFTDSNLKRYFENTVWYKPSPSKELIFNDIERKNIELLQEIENSKPFNLSKVLYYYEFNGFLLVYVGYSIYGKNAPGDTISHWNEGKFILMPNSFSWLKVNKNIPAEILEKNALSTIDVSDAGYCLTDEQIEIEDFDGDINPDSDKELFVYLNGPSDDYSIELYQLDSVNPIKPVLQKLFSIPSSKLTKRIVSGSKLLITAIIRKDYQGTSFYPQEYIYDYLTRTLYQIPNVFEEPLKGPFEYIGMPIPVYYDAISAAKQDRNAELFLLEKGNTVFFLNLFTAIDNGAAQIKFGDRTGWINMQHVKLGKFNGFSAAD